MLHYCTVEEIQEALTASPRFAGTIDNARKAVTDKFNNYIRKNLEYRTGIVEYFDIPDIKYIPKPRLYLSQASVEVGSVVVDYQPYGDWTDEITPLILDTDYYIEYDKHRIMLAGRPMQSKDSIRVTYSGGYQARVIATVTTDTMDCSDALRHAAIKQAVFEVNAVINLESGQQQQAGKKIFVAPPKLVSGLLAEVARDLDRYKVLLGS